MHLNRFWIILFFVGLWTAATPPALTRAQAGASRIGTANLRLVFSNMKETIDVQQKLDKMQEDLGTLIASDQAQLKELQDKVAKAGDPARQDHQLAMSDLDEQSVRFQLQEDNLKNQISRTKTRQLKQAFDEIGSAAADLARSKGLDAILVDTGTQVPAFTENINPQTLANLLFDRSIIYQSDPVDLTSALIESLNKNYKSSTGSAASPTLPMTTMTIGSKVYHLEIAADEANRERGLMERDAMDRDHGMIFAFPEPAEQNFWMHHTRFPLDIIFVDDHGKIVSVHTMKPYDETPVPSDGSSKYAIELSAGEASAVGLKAGQQLNIPATVDAAENKP